MLNASYIKKTNSAKKKAFKKKVKKDPKAKVVKFAKAFYTTYGEMMSKLANE